MEGWRRNKILGFTMLTILVYNTFMINVVCPDASILQEVGLLEKVIQKVDEMAAASSLELGHQYQRLNSSPQQDESEYEFETESNSDSGSAENELQGILDDLEMYMETLDDISISLNHPATDYLPEEVFIQGHNDMFQGIVVDALPYASLIRDRFPSLSLTLLKRLSETNLRRSRRMKERREANVQQGVPKDGTSLNIKDMTGVHTIETAELTGIHSHENSSSYESYKDSAIGSVIGSSTADSADSDTESIFSIAESMASSASSIANKDNSGSRRVPDLPKGHDFDSSFCCQICGDVLRHITNRSLWK